MSTPQLLDLSLAFQAVHGALLPHQDSLNRLDAEYGKHGDEMVSLFTVLAAANEPLSPETHISAVFMHAAQRSAAIPNNLSAQFYAQGLSCFADALSDLDLTLGNLPGYLSSLLSESPIAAEKPGNLSQGQLLKALIKGLSAWNEELNGQQTSGLLGMGYLFDLGIAYLQARQKSSRKLDAVVAVAVHHSPLKSPDYRAVSGELVISTLLGSIIQQAEEAASND